MAGGDPFHHVRDFGFFELPNFAAQWLGLPDNKLWLPKWDLFGYEFQLTKFMVLQVVAGLLTLLIFRDLAGRIRSGKPAAGAWANFWESIALFIRDNVVRPTLGGHHEAHGDEHGHDHAAHVGHDHAAHDGLEHAPHAQRLGHESHDHTLHPEDKHLPFVWTCFFYILFCNLLGAVPMLGSATGNINVTGSLALCALGCTYLVGAKELGGTVAFFKNLVPPLDAPPAMKAFLVPMMFVIEVVGLLIKHGVLAVRLFANIMGGHTVIGVMLSFIAAAPIVDSWLWYLVTPASILGQIGIGMLELFVAFLQAYVFAFLATIFIGMGSHPH
ncbi:MAG: ATP synthase F0 subunit A [Planctomycetales bacterium 12-60-4]|nr:MAG: ATP synthase F0 subunit A [Planctomycetales bacterium 12-60-4]